MYRIFKEQYEADGLSLKEGAVELLTYLKDEGVRTAIASSTRSDIVEMELRDAGLLGYFDVIVGGEMAGASKPAPDIFLLAAEKLRAVGEKNQVADTADEKDMKEFIVIEDSFNGVRAAHAAGATVFMVPDLLAPTEEILKLTNRVFRSLVEVQAWLEGELEDNE